MKGILKLFDIEYPPSHDVSEKLELIPKESSGNTRLRHGIDSQSEDFQSNMGASSQHFGSRSIRDKLGRLFEETDANAATDCASDAHTCLTWLVQLALIWRIEVEVTMLTDFSLGCVPPDPHTEASQRDDSDGVYGKP